MFCWTRSVPGFKRTHQPFRRQPYKQRFHRLRASRRPTPTVDAKLALVGHRWRRRHRQQRCQNVVCATNSRTRRHRDESRQLRDRFERDFNYSPSACSNRLPPIKPGLEEEEEKLQSGFWDFLQQREKEKRLGSEEGPDFADGADSRGG